MRGIFLVASLALIGCSAFGMTKGQEPSYWVLVHTGDRLAQKQILKAEDYAKALIAAGELGYEVVIESEIAYFIPVPAWSESRATAIADLIEESNKSGFGKQLNVSELPASERQHLQKFLSAINVGGELGEMAHETSLKTIEVQRSIDLKFEIVGKEYVVPFSGRDLSGAAGVLPKSESGNVTGNNSKQEATELTRPELYGLGTEEFAISVSSPTTADVFEVILVRVKNILRQKRLESQEQLLRNINSSFDQLFESEALEKLRKGSVDFNDLSIGLQVSILKAAEQNPSAFGVKSETFEFMLRSGRVSMPSEGLRIFINFDLDGTLAASDGTPIKYRVGFEATEIGGG